MSSKLVAVAVAIENDKTLLVWELSSGPTVEALQLQEFSELQERLNEDTVTPFQKQSLRFFSALEVVLPSCVCRSPGVGVADEPVDELEEESDRIAVEYRHRKEIPDVRNEEEPHASVQASCFSWAQHVQEEKEHLSGFSLEEEGLKLPELD
ncbi:RAD52 motif-containing protein 1-like [Carlito syrichta]|uniref:RAD52 motif-containing protein 1-like n=1 Tax=Carlito syrichta TaxID=1868482 RepID=A0A1U7THE5_CARSF|nr:RAD52 motif-containing protein 1-like [Carlito syrichta]